MNSFKEEKCRGNVYPNSQKIVAVMYCAQIFIVNAVFRRARIFITRNKIQVICFIQKK